MGKYGRGARGAHRAPRAPAGAADGNGQERRADGAEGRQPAPKRWMLPRKTAQKVKIFCVTLRAPFAQNRAKKGFCVILWGLTAARLSAHLRGSAT